jgi:hypothetical protein
MSHRPAERLKIFNEVVTVTSGTGATSLRYYAGDCYKVSFIVGMGTAAASTVTVPTVAIMQSGDEAGATNAAITGATGSFGPSTAFQVEGQRSALITMTTASTLTETVVVTVGGNSYTMTYSTAPSTVSTALSFGATAGSTAGTQMAAVTNSFSSVINNSTLSHWLTAATVSTAVVRLTVNDSAISTGFSLLSTGVNILPSQEKAQSIIEVLSEDLNATSQYVYAVVSSADTSVQFSIAVIKDGMRNSPIQVGQHVKST